MSCLNSKGREQSLLSQNVDVDAGLVKIFLALLAVVFSLLSN